MVQYVVWALTESDVLFSGSAERDGVMQGNGSHRVGQTMTVDSSQWTPIDITGAEFAFQGCDNRTLTTAQTFGGVTYGAGTRVEAEYSFVVSQGAENWTVTSFNFVTTSPEFRAAEGIAIACTAPPPTGVPLRIVSAQEGPGVFASSHFTPPCFVAGSRIATDRGLKSVETLVEGDRVLTRDSGYQPVLSAIRRKFWAVGKCAPIEIAAGVLGAESAVRVSQRHRLLVGDRTGPSFTGLPEAFAMAGDLENGTTIRKIEGGRVEYVHLLLPQHSVILSDGMWSESFFPGDVALGELTSSHQAEIQSCMDQYGIDTFGSLARPMVHKSEALAAA